MARDSTPYEYAGERPTPALAADPPGGCREGADTVIVDGRTMSFRSYRRRDDGR